MGINVSVSEYLIINVTCFLQVHLWRLHSDKLWHFPCSYHDRLSGLQMKLTVSVLSTFNTAFTHFSITINQNILKLLLSIHFDKCGPRGDSSAKLCMAVCCCGCVFTDPYRRGLERGDVQRYSLPRWSKVWHVVFCLLYSSHPFWKLYPSC